MVITLRGIRRGTAAAIFTTLAATAAATTTTPASATFTLFSTFDRAGFQSRLDRLLLLAGLLRDRFRAAWLPAFGRLFAAQFIARVAARLIRLATLAAGRAIATLLLSRGLVGTALLALATPIAPLVAIAVAAFTAATASAASATFVAIAITAAFAFGGTCLGNRLWRGRGFGTEHADEAFPQ